MRKKDLESSLFYVTNAQLNDDPQNYTPDFTRNSDPSNTNDVVETGVLDYEFPAVIQIKCKLL